MKIFALVMVVGVLVSCKAHLARTAAEDGGVAPSGTVLVGSEINRLGCNKGNVGQSLDHLWRKFSDIRISITRCELLLR